MPRYPDYDSLPQHIREMLVAVTKDDGQPTYTPRVGDRAPLTFQAWKAT